MSIEEALKENAAASLELAKAMRFYAETINKYGLKIEQANTGEEPAASTTSKTTTGARETAAQKKAREKAEAAAAAAAEEGDDDGFGSAEPEGDEEPELTADTVKAILLQVRDKHEDKGPALAIIAKFGYKAIPDIKPKDYAAIYKAAEKELAK